MALKTTIKTKEGRATKTYKTKEVAGIIKGYDWWLTKDPAKKAEELVATVAFLKQGQGNRQRQAAIHARLYSGQALFSFVGSNMSKMDQISGLASSRPTFNVISSIIDTLVSRLTQSRPQPVFLTDNSDYKERNLAKKLNNFIQGEFYQTKAYRHGEFILTDALALGTGVIKILETQDHKVGLERVLCTELFVDLQEAAFGDPRRLYQVKLIDRQVLESMFPKKLDNIVQAEKANIDNSSEASKSVSDLVLVVEGWALPSGEDTEDGRHTIACSSGMLFDEPFEKKTFPFVFLHHHKRMLGFWSQGVAEAQMGTQIELNSLLDTISKSIKLVGVPRVFYEEGSKVNKAAFANKIGVLIPYRGTKPSYEVAPCVPQEMYAERDRIIQYGYQSEGLSNMAATSQKPAGLNSGEAIRSYDDINTDRFAALSRRYDNVFIDLTYQIIDKAIDIAKEQGTYQTVFSDRQGTKEIDLPDVKLLQDPFVIQCFNESSLPRDPAGRKQTIADYVQAGMLSIKEARRLLNFPDLQQIETLDNASEERIFCYLDQIIEDGKYNPPDPFMDLALAEELSVKYYNLYACRKLEEPKQQMIRDFFTQIQTLKQAAMPQQAPAASAQPTAAPEPTPQSPLVNSNAGGQVAA